MKTTVHTMPVIEQTEQNDSAATHRNLWQEAGDLIKTALLFSAVSGVGVAIAMSVYPYIFVS